MLNENNALERELPVQGRPSVCPFVQVAAAAGAAAAAAAVGVVVVRGGPGAGGRGRGADIASRLPAQLGVEK